MAAVGSWDLGEADDFGAAGYPPAARPAPAERSLIEQMADQRTVDNFLLRGSVRPFRAAPGEDLRDVAPVPTAPPRADGGGGGGGYGGGGGGSGGGGSPRIRWDSLAFARVR